MGIQYDKLLSFLGINFDTSATARAYDATLQRLLDCKQALQRFRAHPGIGGQTWDAASSWLARFEQDMQALDVQLTQVRERYEAAREAMRAAKEAGEKISSELVTPLEQAQFAGQTMIEVNGRQMTGELYLQYLAQQREAEREARAKEILDTMNASVEAHVGNLRAPMSHTSTPIAEAAPLAGAGLGAAVAAPLAVGRSPFRTGADIYRDQTQRSGREIVQSDSVLRDRRMMGSWAGLGQTSRRRRSDYFAPYDETPYSEHVVNPKWTSDGPVGGYTPPSVLDADDPRWSPNFGPKDTSPVVTGGVLGLLPRIGR